MPRGNTSISFEHPNDPDVPALAGRIGSLPLPPYVKRPANAADAERYQTVYADDAKRTAAAAPTAGLHFTPELLEQLERRGHPIHDLTLSVGLGTFRPIETERVDDHPMHGEAYVLPPAAKAALREPGSLLASPWAPPPCGRSSITSPKAKTPNPKASTTRAEADLFIRPPYSFLGVDALLTNFHLPGSTLLCLVAAFLQNEGNDGLDLLKDLYAQALDNDYRFYSYGDAMLLL